MSLGKVSVAIEAQMASFESDMGRAARIADKEFKKIERDAKRTEAQMRSIGKAMGLAIVAGATAATVALKGAINAMDDMSKAAQKANLPTEDFSRLAYAGKLADVSMEDLTGSLGKLAKAQAEALKSTSQQGRVFDALGISVKNADGSLRSTGAVFSDFADHFQQMKGSPEIVAAGMQIFGRSFQNLIPLLKDGADGLRLAAEESDALGQTLSTEAGQQAEQFNDDLTRLQAAATGLAMAVAQNLMPDLLNLSGQFVDTASNGQRTKETAEEIGNAIRTAGEIVSFVGGYFTAFGDVIEGLTTGMIGLYEAAAGLVTLDWNRIKAGMNVANEGADLAYYGGGDKAAAGGPDFSNVRGGSSTKLSVEAQANAIKAQRAQAEALRKALGDPDPKGKAKGTGRTKSGTSALETAAREAQKARDELVRLVEQTERAGAEFDALAASLAGPLSEAAYRFSVEQERLNELARTGEIDAGRLQAAQGQLRAEYEKNVEAIKAQLTPAQEVQAAILEEIKLLGMSAQAQEIYNNLKAAGVEANSAFGESITASTQELQAMREQAAFMADVQSGLADAFVEMASGAKSAKEAFGDFADQLFARALQFVADKAIEAMFDAFSGQGAASGGASSGGGGGWAGLLTSVMGAFGGGRANGGPVSGGNFYEVGENNRPEMFKSRGKQYLIPGNDGAVMPMRSGGGASQVVNFHLGAPTEPRTQSQIAARMAFETQRATSRNR